MGRWERQSRSSRCLVLPRGVRARGGRQGAAMGRFAGQGVKPAAPSELRRCSETLLSQSSCGKPQAGWGFGSSLFPPPSSGSLSSNTRMPLPPLALRLLRSFSRPSFLYSDPLRIKGSPQELLSVPSQEKGHHCGMGQIPRAPNASPYLLAMGGGDVCGGGQGAVPPWAARGASQSDSTSQQRPLPSPISH